MWLPTVNCTIVIRLTLDMPPTAVSHRIITVKSPMLSLRWPRRFTLYSPLKRPIKDPPEMGTDLYISIKDEADYAKHIRYLIWLTRR